MSAGVSEQSLYFYTLSDDLLSDDSISSKYDFRPRITLVNCIIKIYGVLQLSAVIDGSLTSGIIPAAIDAELEVRIGLRCSGFSVSEASSP